MVPPDDELCYHPVFGKLLGLSIAQHEAIRNSTRVVLQGASFDLVLIRSQSRCYSIKNCITYESPGYRYVKYSTLFYFISGYGLTVDGL